MAESENLQTTHDEAKDGDMPSTIDLRYALALADDMPLAEEEELQLEYMKTHLGDALYAQALHLVVGRRTTPEVARQEWDAVVAHRKTMEEALHRNVSLQTAALDYFHSARRTEPEVAIVPYSTLRQLLQDPHIDSTTGLFTPGSFRWSLEHELRRARRYSKSVTLVLLDLDDMDRVNHRRGHAFGDFVLKEVADLIHQNIRNTDTAARLETDLFAIILPECKVSDGRNLAERLRACVERQSFSLAKGDEGTHITASLGLAGYPRHGESPDALINVAHEGLWRAKQAGKNRVEVATPDEDYKPNADA